LAAGIAVGHARRVSARPLVVALVLAVATTAGAHSSLDVVRDALDADAATRPGDATVALRQAELHRVAREWDAALVALERASWAGADADEVTATRGLVLLDAGQPAAARRELDAVLARRPDAAAVRFARGRAWMRLGRPKRAARDFGRAIAGLAPPTPDQVIAHRDALLAVGEPRAALRALDGGMARVGRVASLELAAIDLETALGRWDAAVRRLDVLLAATPANPAWIARRGELLAAAGRRDAARAELQHALAVLAARPAVRRTGAVVALERRVRDSLDALEATP
jgi:tetratricopeptide (TPR) repeat protein